eukprot:m.153224 g.153224  ORF g.153224 m.153224 type:complete len:56 (-) comp16366_c2_seq55:230-397(-)
MAEDAAYVCQQDNPYCLLQLAVLGVLQPELGIDATLLKWTYILSTQQVLTMAGTC